MIANAARAARPGNRRRRACLLQGSRCEVVGSCSGQDPAFAARRNQPDSFLTGDDLAHNVKMSTQGDQRPDPALFCDMVNFACKAVAYVHHSGDRPAPRECFALPHSRNRLQMRSHQLLRPGRLGLFTARPPAAKEPLKACSGGS